jgi:hypothetical protein
MSVLLPEEEIVAVAGGYKRPGDQLRELHRQGFYRARRSRVTGRVVLERAHYDAVCAGARPDNAPAPRVRPTLRAIT